MEHWLARRNESDVASSADSPETTNQPSDGGGGGAAGLPHWAIVVIAVCGGLILASVWVIFIWLHFRRKRRAYNATPQDETDPRSEKKGRAATRRQAKRRSKRADAEETQQAKFVNKSFESRTSTMQSSGSHPLQEQRSSRYSHLQQQPNVYMGAGRQEHPSWSQGDLPQATMSHSSLSRATPSPPIQPLQTSVSWPFHEESASLRQSPGHTANISSSESSRSRSQSPTMSLFEARRGTPAPPPIKTQGLRNSRRPPPVEIKP